MLKKRYIFFSLDKSKKLWQRYDFYLKLTNANSSSQQTNLLIFIGDDKVHFGEL